MLVLVFTLDFSKQQPDALGLELEPEQSAEILPFRNTVRFVRDQLFQKLLLRMRQHTFKAVLDRLHEMVVVVLLPPSLHDL
ncbi:hypothetical protein D3C80_2019380 [compost metagenome]